MRLFLFLLLLALSMPAAAFELATRITRSGDTARLQTSGYAKLVLLRRETAVQGSFHVSGRLSVSGTANVVMWSRVDGRYYFSRLPQLQHVSDRDGLGFDIPFDAGEKTVTEILIEVELPRGGSIAIGGLDLRGG
jgi:hypothetical protein